MASQVEVQNQESTTKAATPTFLNFSFFKVDTKWRWLNDIAKSEAAKEFSLLIEVANTKMKVRTYSTLGLRSDTDFMLWMVSDSVEKMQVLTSKVYSTLIGKYIEPSYVYLSCLRKSVYSDNKIVPGFMANVKPMKYVVVYPFIKAREWYLLALDERKELMEEHISVGRKFPQVRLNTSYSFGINDQDFMLAFEVDDLIIFQDLIVQLRETRLSKYVIKDTPMIVGVHKVAEDIIRSVG